MKNIILSLTFIAALILSSCGAKEETREKINDDKEFVDETQDTTNYPDYEEFVSDGVGEEINPVDSSTVETMNYNENSKEELVSEKEQPKEIKKEVKPVVKEAPKVHETRYYVVVGSFKKFSNAQNLSTYFKQKGYYPLILPKVNDYNRVAITSFVEKPNAKRAIEKLRKEHNDLTFWIYKW
ncbi:MAG: SPOR domain-containing protein [Bacteroidales bacterium]|nr:SPOR domain-containing protein [Bacteroidales bacterium]MBN2757928.1 SPOR domain-containing protein [Bacteroidales bacterium]